MSLEIEGIPYIKVLRFVADDSMHDDMFKMTYVVDGDQSASSSRELMDHHKVIHKIVIPYLEKRTGNHLTYSAVTLYGNSDCIYTLYDAVKINIELFRANVEELQ